MVKSDLEESPIDCWVIFLEENEPDKTRNKQKCYPNSHSGLAPNVPKLEKEENLPHFKSGKRREYAFPWEKVR